MLVEETDKATRMTISVSSGMPRRALMLNEWNHLCQRGVTACRKVEDSEVVDDLVAWDESGPYWWDQQKSLWLRNGAESLTQEWKEHQFAKAFQQSSKELLHKCLFVSNNFQQSQQRAQGKPGNGIAKTRSKKRVQQQGCRGT
eukprot:4885261-Amphidinium_carterae.1